MATSMLKVKGDQILSMDNNESDTLSYLLEIATEVLFVLCLFSGIFAFMIWERRKGLKRKQQSLAVDCSADRVTSAKGARVQAVTKVRKSAHKWSGGPSPAKMILAAESSEQVLRLWRMYEQDVPFSEVSEVVVMAYLDVQPNKLVKEVVGHLLRTDMLMTCSAQLLDLVVERKNLEVLDALIVAFKQHFFLPNSMAKAVISAYAMAGDESRLDAWLNCNRRGDKAPTKSLIWAVRGLLLAKHPDAALRYAKEIVAQGQQVDQKVVTGIYKSFISAGRAAEGIYFCMPEFAPTPFAGAALMEDCFEKSDLEVAKIVEAMLKEKNIDIHPKAYENYLKLLLRVGDRHARQIWSEMKADGLILNVTEADGVIYHEYLKLLGKYDASVLHAGDCSSPKLS